MLQVEFHEICSQGSSRSMFKLVENACPSTVLRHFFVFLSRHSYMKNYLTYLNLDSSVSVLNTLYNFHFICTLVSVFAS